jgi:hypothetical protein
MRSVCCLARSAATARRRPGCCKVVLHVSDRAGEASFARAAAVNRRGSGWLLQEAATDGDRCRAWIFPTAVRLPYPLDVGNDVWVGAITTLVGAALGGAISFVLSRQQLNDARLQRKEEETREQHRRSDERRFQAYSEFLARARAYRNAVQAYYLHSDNRPSIDELDVLLQTANDASALVFLLVESEGTYEGCRAVLGALWRARTITHHIESSSADDPWAELNKEFGRAMREFQNAARHELGVSGPAHPWVMSDARSYPDIRGGPELKPSDQQR